MRCLALWTLVLLAVACGDDAAPPDGGRTDGGGVRTDGGDVREDGGAPGDGGAATDGGPATGRDGGPPVMSSGCGGPVRPDGALSVDVPGQGARTYLVELPGGYDPDTAWPVVFGFHGATTSGMLFASRYYGNLASTMGDSVILVYPDALGSPTAWDDTRDVPFFDAVVEAVKRDYCVDEDRIFATGHSSGGFFSNALGCQRGNVLRAIAPVSGGGPFGRPTCMGDLGVLLAHGNMDGTVDFSLGVGSRDFWAMRNGCDTSMTTGSPPSPCVAYLCTGEPEQWCEYDGGHEWPDFAPAAIWAFFGSF